MIERSACATKLYLHINLNYAFHPSYENEMIFNLQFATTNKD